MRYFILLFVCISPLFLQGQQKYHYAMHAFRDGSNVYLRWAPKDIQSWKAGITYGYQLDRYTLINNYGDTTKIDDVPSTKVTLLEMALPLPVDNWQSLAENNDRAGVAAASLYGDTIEIDGISPNALVNMVDQNNINESKYNYGLLAADLDYQVAVNMGLGYTDQEHNSEGIMGQFLYVLTLAQNMDTLVEESGTCIVSVDSLSELSIIDTIYGFGSDKQATIGWSKSPNNDYTAYNIEKSIDGGSTFNRVNANPFVILEADQPDKISFNDTLDNNIDTFVYRVRGINGFGIEGPASDTIQIKGKETRLKCYALITDVDEVANQDMTITWSLIEVEDSIKLQELNIYKATNDDGPYEKLNASPLPITQTQFTDTSATVSNYYKVIITDVNGYKYESINSLAQLADSIPPSVPEGLVGTCNKYGLVELKWNQNTESDFNGYRVFISNFADSSFVQISNDIIRDSTYDYTTNLNTLTRKVYFRITAEDTRHNRSEQSATCEITRPDIVPPSNPQLFDAKALPAGIDVSFVPSLSTDVAIHKLQKRKKGARIWSTIYSINGVQTGNTTYAYVDSNVTREYVYQYRVLAYDQSGNYSSSKVFDIRAYDSGIRGNIFEVEVDKVEYTPSNYTTFDTNFINRYPNTVNIVQWKYSDTTDIYNFQIYRSIDDSPFRIYDVIYVPQDTIREASQLRSQINLSKYWYIDYKMLGKYGFEGALSGGQSIPGIQSLGGGINSSGERTYKYKIIANHRDGATSRLSSDVSIVIN
jgi:hypothetical protein